MQYSYFSLYSVFPHKKVHLFRNILLFLPPPTLYKVETGKKIIDLFEIHASNFVCGVRGGVGPVGIGKHLRMQKRPKTFVHGCRFEIKSQGS